MSQNQCILVNSTAVKKGLQRVIPHYNGNIITLYNPISQNRLQLPSGYNRKELRDSLGISSRHIVIGAVARMFYSKGMDLLVEACLNLCRKYSEIKILVIGEGHRKQQLKEMVSHSSFQKSFSFLGHRTDIASLIKAMDIFVVPSRHGGFENTVFEGVGQGVATVLTNTIGPAEVLIDHKHCLIVEPKARGIQDAVEKLLKDTTLRESIAVAGAQFVNENHSMATHVIKLKSLYGSLLQQKR